MTSVSYDETCPKCKYDEAYYELDMRRRSESLFCQRCGYSLEYITCIDSKTGKWEKKKNGDGYWERKYENQPFGAFRMKYKDGISRAGSLAVKVTHEMIDEFQRMIDDGEIEEKGSYLTRWNADKKFGEIIIGSVKDISFFNTSIL